jgi:hypothetical protein
MSEDFPLVRSTSGESDSLYPGPVGDQKKTPTPRLREDVENWVTSDDVPEPICSGKSDYTFASFYAGRSDGKSDDPFASFCGGGGDGKSDDNFDWDTIFRKGTSVDNPPFVNPFADRLFDEIYGIRDILIAIQNTTGACSNIMVVDLASLCTSDALKKIRSFPGYYFILVGKAPVWAGSPMDEEITNKDVMADKLAIKSIIDINEREESGSSRVCGIFLTTTDFYDIKATYSNDTGRFHRDLLKWTQYKTTVPFPTGLKCRCGGDCHYKRITGKDKDLRVVQACLKMKKEPYTNRENGNVVKLQNMCFLKRLFCIHHAMIASYDDFVVQLISMAVPGNKYNNRISNDQYSDAEILMRYVEDMRGKCDVSLITSSGTTQHSMDLASIPMDIGN